MSGTENIRQRTEKNERLILSQYAAFSDASKGRERPEEKCDIRTDFQRDRDRIIHCKSFRRLKHKTQVFLAPEGDHYRTRLTHTLEVAQIARTVARALRLNEDLTEAIALGHDLGHTPFGHAGERAIRSICGNFTHYEQSVRVCKFVEKGGKGLNLTYEVVDGILNHTTGEWAKTLEGKIVRYCDRIAYINHDIDDAVRAGVISASDIPKPLRDYFGETKSTRINKMVNSLISGSESDIGMDAETFDNYNKLHEFLTERVYKNPECKGEETKVQGIISGLYDYYIKNPDLIPQEFNTVREKEGTERAAIDHIAGMTDRFAIRNYTDVYVPRSWDI